MVMFQWIIIAVLSIAVFGEGLALALLTRRVRDLSWTRSELLRLRARLDGLEAPTHTRVDAPESSLPGGPLPMARRSESAPVSSRTLIAVPSLSRLPERPDANAYGLERRYGELWARADAGESTADLARDLDLPIGQIELILNLRRPLAEVRGPS